MESHEALQEAIGGKTIEHAKRLGVSTILVNKWKEPHKDFTDSGAYNPLDRIETIVETALRLGVKRETAFQPIHYLAMKFGLICIPLPSVTEHQGVTSELVGAIKEFSDLAQAVSMAMSDMRISEIEAKKIEQEGAEALRAITTLLHIARESVR